MSLWTDNVVFHGLFYIISGLIICLLGMCEMHLREIRDILRWKYQPGRPSGDKSKGDEKW